MRCLETGSPFRRLWHGALSVTFAILGCLFCYVEFSVQPATTLCLFLGGAALGFWCPPVALIAFTAAIPLLTGLSQTALLGGQAASLVFFSLWLGSVGKRWSQTSHGASRGLWPDLLALEIFATATVLSLLWQIYRHLPATTSLAECVNDSQGYGSPHYFLTSAFLWLQGCFYMHWLLSQRGADLPQADTIHHVFVAYASIMLLFCGVQILLQVPERWVEAGLQSPYEDISSFGSIAVAVLLFALATLGHQRTSNSLIGASLVGAGLLMVVTSWSRAAWLAALTWILAWSCLRLSRIAFLTIAAGIAVGIILLNLCPSHPIITQNAYLSRLSKLVRFESPQQKQSGRYDLYRRAIRMIQKRPLSGHGIGSFYLTSPQYAPIDEGHSRVPDFAHNVFLQIAAEQGVPIALLVAYLCGRALWLGFRTWFRDREHHTQPASQTSLIFGVTLSLAAYLQTQMTANSLNVYVSNQFFFWFLMAALLSLAKPPVSAPGKSGPMPRSG